jgi:hypothetical protein
MKRVLTVVAAIGIALGGYIHFRLWHGVYRHAPVREMFLIDVVLSAFLTIAVFIPRRVFAAAGAVLTGGSLAAIALSRTVGLPTFHGKWTEVGLAPQQSLFGINETLLVIIAESVAFLVCCTLVYLYTQARTPVASGARRRGAKVPEWATPL